MRGTHISLQSFFEESVSNAIESTRSSLIAVIIPALAAFFIVAALNDLIKADITSIIMVHDLNGVRAPEPIKAGRFAINGVDLAPAEKTIENGRKIVKFRTEKTVAAIRKTMAEGRQ